MPDRDRAGQCWGGQCRGRPVRAAGLCSQGGGDRRRPPEGREGQPDEDIRSLAGPVQGPAALFHKAAQQDHVERRAGCGQRPPC